MEKNRYKLGVLLLLGLIGYFLTLSALWVALAGSPDDGNSKPPKALASGKDDPKQVAKNFGSGGISAGDNFGTPVPGMTGTGHCPWALACYAPGHPGDEEQTGRARRIPGGVPAGNDKGAFGGGFSYPASTARSPMAARLPIVTLPAGPFFSGPGPAFGPYNDFAKDDPSTGNDDPAGKGQPAFSPSGPDSGPPAPDLDPSLFPPEDTHDPETPQVTETAAPTPVPEPSTFWLLMASLAAFVTSGSIGRTFRAPER